MVKNIALALGSFLLCFIVIEFGYRILDPFPFYSRNQINTTENGNLMMYDPSLGWKGVPEGKAQMISDDSSVWIAHNKLGYRDIDHSDLAKSKPAIVFLGDSFTWGFEVEFEDMFVNRLRSRLPDYELFNLGHPGYGTDQELLAFRQWHDNRPLKAVILMFYENDIADNNSSVRYQKPKPYFRIVDNRLVLNGVPVPKDDGWSTPDSVERTMDSWKENLKVVLFRSHFLHDIHFRKYMILRRASSPGIVPPKDKIESDLSVTGRVLDELKMDVERRGAKLTVFFVPSKNEVEHLNDSSPYQIEIARLCRERSIEYFDLAPNLKESWFRTYYRKGGHWNSRGNKVAADAIYQFLTREVRP